MNTKILDRGGQHYESPALDLIELIVESSVCVVASGDSIGDALENDWDTI